MINRVLLRIKIIQAVYSFYKGGGKSISTAEKELFYSIEKTYELYFHLLQLSVEVTKYAVQRIDARKNKLRPTDEDLNPNTRFIDNTFVDLLSQNEHLNNFMAEHKISWADNLDTVKLVYDLTMESDFYAEYMAAERTDFTTDKNLWRKIFRNLILQCEEFFESIEDQSIYWTDDLDIVVSFIIKTIKRFDLKGGVEQKLLPLFRDEDDAEFASKLFRETLENEVKLLEMVDKNTKNWDLDRIAFMDIIIMQIAL